jgi:hypothetical protein
MRTWSMRNISVLFGLTASFFIGCGGAPIPYSQTAQAQSAVGAAEAVGAAKVPQAALHLKMAKDQLQTAQALIAADDNADAALVLERAQADAELALVLARAAQAKTQASAALARVRELEAAQQPNGGGSHEMSATEVDP